MTMENGSDPPAPETIAEILALDDEARAALPPERQTVHIDAVREHLESERAAAAAAAEARIRAEQESRDAAQRDENARVAQAQDDVRFAEDIDARLASDDEAVRRTAQLDRQNNAERYAAGVSAKVNQSASATMNRVLKEHYGALTQLMMQQKQYPEFITKIADLTTQAGNNPLVAAIKYGEGLAADAAFARGKEEGARAERIALGREGVQDMGTPPPGGMSREDYSNPAWVTEQRSKDPEWAFKMSADGKRTNLQRMRESAVSNARKAG